MKANNSNTKKTEELLVYVASKLSGKRNYGVTLLSKVLYFIDNIHYLKHGRPVSALRYIKQEFGPTPEPAAFLSLRDALVRAGAIEIVDADYFGLSQTRYMARREADLSMFSATEVELIDDVIADKGDWTGVQASEMSHRSLAWQIADNKEILPFYTFLLSATQPSDDDIKWARAELDGIPGC